MCLLSVSRGVPRRGQRLDFAAVSLASGKFDLSEHALGACTLALNRAKLAQHVGIAQGVERELRFDDLSFLNLPTSVVRERVEVERLVRCFHRCWHSMF